MCSNFDKRSLANFISAQCAVRPGDGSRSRLMPVEESRDIHSRARRLCPVITVIRLTGSTTAIYSLFRKSDGNDRLYRSPSRFDKHVTINAGREGSRLKLTAVRRIGTGRGRRARAPLYLRRMIATRRHLYAFSPTARAVVFLRAAVRELLQLLLLPLPS
jgi:hypothetical protein